MSFKFSDTDNLREHILTSTHIHEAINHYVENKSKFSNRDSDLIRSVLLNKLISSNPLGLFAILCKLGENSMDFNCISKFLEKKGGSISTVHQWMGDFEALDYLHSIPSSKRSKYQYSLKEPLSEILRELPSSYCQMIEENLIKDNISLQKNDIFKEIDSIIEYIKCIDNRISSIVVNNNSEEPFETTKIIKTLLDCGATISEAFYVLDGVLDELNEIYEIKSEKKYISIDKRKIPDLIISVLEKPCNFEIDHLLYWYTVDNIIEEIGIKHNDNAAQLIKKEILRKKWKKSEFSDIYYKSFENVYGCNFNDLKNKKLFLDKIDNFLKEIENFTNDNSSKSQNPPSYILFTKYNMLTRNVALSILIYIGRLGSNESPVENLHNIIKENQSPLLKVNDINNFFEFISILRDFEEPLSKYLYSKLPLNIQWMIDRYNIYDKIDLSFKTELIKSMNYIIESQSTYNEIKDIISFTPELQKTIEENKNDYSIINRMILDNFFVDSVSKNSVNKKIKDLQLSNYYTDFGKTLEFTVRSKCKNTIDNEIEFSKLASNLNIIKAFYQTLDF